MSPTTRAYRGDGITVHYDAVRCIHAAECVRGLPQVFDPDKRPWIDPSAAAADRVAEVVMRCPTGALTFQREDGGVSEAPPDTNTVMPAPDGPLYVCGRLRVVDAAGDDVFVGTRVALCRCGASNHKPFCDGAHAAAGFHDPGQLTRQPPDADAAPGSLTITLATNGPLLFQGPYTLIPVDGGDVCADKGALCRCGQSAAKPMCDGSHTRAAFEG